MNKRTATYGEILKKAEQFKQLQEKLTVLIKRQKVLSITELCQKSNVSTATYYKGIRENNLSAEDLSKFFTTLVEVQNIFDLFQQNQTLLLNKLEINHQRLLDQIDISEEKFYSCLANKNFRSGDLFQIFNAMLLIIKSE